MYIFFNWKKFNNNELIILESYDESSIKNVSTFERKNYSELFKGAPWLAYTHAQMLPLRRFFNRAIK